MGVAVGKIAGIVVGVGGDIGADVCVGVGMGVGVDEVHDTNTGTTAIAKRANKVLRFSTTIAETLLCKAKAIMTLSL